MSASPEQPRTPPAGAPSYRKLEGMVDPPMVGPPLKDSDNKGPGRITAEQYDARGTLAYHDARDREKVHGLDPETIALYREASVNLASSVAEEASNAENPVENPIRLLMSAGSIAKQAQAEYVSPYQEPQFDQDGNPIVADRRKELARTADELFAHAGDILMRQDEEVTLIRDGESVAVPASGAFKSTVKKALRATGVKTQTAMQEVETADDITGVMGVIDADTIDDSEVKAKTAELAVEQWTDAHKVLVEA